jgi:diguanylate cyclase (GGDEF)-like protein
LKRQFSLSPWQFTIEQKIVRSFLTGILLVLAIGAVSLWLQWQANLSQLRIAYDQSILAAVQDLSQSEVDAETGQRGFLITGDSEYLTPYSTGVVAVESNLARLQSLLRDTPENRVAMQSLRALSNAKLAEMAKTIDLRRKSGFKAAQAVVDTGIGNNALDQIRAIETKLNQFYSLKLGQESRQTLVRTKWAFGFLLVFGICLVPLLIMAYFRILRDLRERVEMSHSLNYEANHDAMTGLSNRQVFSTNLEAAVNRAQSGNATYSLLFLDLDKFQKINDVLGHQMGDRVLCEIARRLEVTLRKNDVVARLGGDEFGIIAQGDADELEHQAGAKRFAERLLVAIREPIELGDTRIEVGASIGIAFCRCDTKDIQSLLRTADIAMFQAKESGRNTFRFFDQGMDNERRDRETLDNELIKAVAEEKIQPYYQPLISLGDSRICGFEALARWQHLERGFIPSDVFIPIVERLGLMTDMTASILRQTCRDAGQWPADIRVSVNFPPSELIDPLLPSRILKIIEQEIFDPGRLEVEVTETGLVSDIIAATATIKILRGIGITICLDDFGTGYSSLYHLRELKFDKVKIDRSFVQAMQENLDSERIIDAILGLTKSLNLPTVAEGIENPAAMVLLAAKGCEYGQGYYFAEAMTGDSVVELLRKTRTLPLPSSNWAGRIVSN